MLSEEDLRKAIEIFNDDTVFDEKTIGLVSERFGILEPLPPARAHTSSMSSSRSGSWSASGRRTSKACRRQTVESRAHESALGAGRADSNLLRGELQPGRDYGRLSVSEEGRRKRRLATRHRRLAE